MNGTKRVYDNYTDSLCLNYMNIIMNYNNDICVQYHIFFKKKQIDLSIIH